ncbi:MAG: EAL domain-containing protein [Alphaproteobacteria bacterium]|nr:EAL domain-containing protein [Alphaproteobacteria bacterium]
MSKAIPALVALSLAVIWSALGVLLNKAVLLPALDCALVAVVGFILSSNLYALVLRGRERAALAEELARLRFANEEQSHALAMANRRMFDLTEALEHRVDEKSVKVVGEVKVLEALIRDFADGIAGRVKALEAQGNDMRPPAPRAGEPGEATGRSYVEDLAGPELLAAIRKSLIENRVDLYLQPIVSLPHRRLRFYEAFTRLRMPDGATIMPAQYLRVAEPAGLMSAIDNLLLFRCVQVIRRLTRSARDIAIFCNISGYSFSDRTFFPQFLEFMSGNRDLSGHIVFEFTQDTLRSLSDIEEANLRVLADLGFAFSLDKVTSLDLDLAALRERRFKFVKAPARLMLDQDASARGIAASDVKELLARQGLSLIAEKVEEERHVVNLLDFGVDYGQGYLFGEPRPIREAMVAPVTPAGPAAPATPQRKSAAS